MKVSLYTVSSIGLVLFLQACSIYQARQAIEARQREFALNNEAWQVARLRLKAMCSKPLQTVEEYQQGQAIKNAGGQDPFRGCNIRIVKATNAPVTNDWQWDWLPSYQTIVAVHEEELRKRVAPKPYEEYMLGLSRLLAKSTDNGSITPKELVDTFNAGWNYMVSAMKNESALLAGNLDAAQLSDAQTWKTIGQIAGGLAAVATATLVASAAASAARETYVPPPSYVGPLTTPAPYYPPPKLGQPLAARPREIHCQARQPAYTVYIDCYESR